jgi:hypothetical protein
LRTTWGNSLQNPVSKILNTKKAGGVVKVVECLLSKHEIQSSNSSTTTHAKKNSNRVMVVTPVILATQEAEIRRITV